ncbi:MAG: ABC transporter permease [Methanobacteriaceae archaeon]|nr:ABC transporter permease [Methanobacteriaceae archaeon]
MIETDFLKLILKNPFRNKSRAILSILGIMIGILVIISLGSISDGLVNSMEDSNKGEFYIMNNTVENYGTPANLNESSIENIKNIDGVEHMAGIVETQYMSGSESYSIIGLDNKELGFMKIGLTSGNPYNTDDQIVIGKLLADEKNKKIGDTINIKNKDYTITGIFETGDRGKDNSIIMNLAPARDIGKLEDGEVFLETVQVKAGSNVDTVRNKVNDSTSNEIIALTDASELDSVKGLLNIINSATIVISGLSIVIGGLGVINTMLMSVFDRTKEIGLLKAVGWSDKRIISMILGESIIITLTSFVIAAIIAIIGLSIVSYLGYFNAVYTVKTFGIALIVSIVVGLVGGFYPAYRASKFQPTEALRYE